MNSTPEQLRFASIPGCSIRADFAGGGLSSDLGPLLLKGVDRQIGLTERVYAAIDDICHAHVKAGSVRGVSIGFDLLKDGARFVNGVRHLTAIKLIEISLVTFAANPLCQVETIKSRADLEQRARESLGLSKSQARRLAHVGWPVLNVVYSELTADSFSS